MVLHSKQLGSTDARFVYEVRWEKAAVVRSEFSWVLDLHARSVERTDLGFESPARSHYVSPKIRL